MSESDTSNAAKTLSELGASKGGKARAASLSKEERSAIARRAAAARWDAKRTAYPKETHKGIIKIGEIELRCGVLDNGIRVFSTRGVTRALGGTGTGTRGNSKNGAPQLPPFLEADSLKPHLSSQLMARLLSPVQYQPIHGGRTAYGYEASLLPELCELILDANDIKPLKVSQQHFVATANLLIRGFARVGIIALVDEATGYQEDRAKDELSKILEAYIAEELRPYISKFPNEFFKQIYRIYGWKYKLGVNYRPSYVGKFINKYIYEPLPPGVLDRMRELNPKNDKGNRRYKHFQFLTDNVGEPHLEKQLAVTTSLLKLSENPRQFDHNFQKVFAKEFQPMLPLIVDVED